MDYDFSGRTALITGAASGMGLLTSKCLKEMGANVVMLDIDEAALKEKAAEISADMLVCDVRRYDDIEKAALYARDKYGSVDITVSYAGGCPSRVCKAGKNFNDLPIDVIDWGVEVNFRAPLYMARAVFNIMREQKRGVIVNIASIDALTGSAAADYSSEKSGLFGLTKSIALMGAADGIRCCCVTPGPVLTRPAMANMRTPMGRAAEVREVVDMVLYLCSDKASFITGANVTVDGGRQCGAREY
ncbi:MAG: SDR family oxidoreductase [Clostridiales bacterium]|nr:SDR family oxidoreductase [Clostridiales bacterium]